MNEQCFYCQNVIQDGNYYGTFVQQNEHIEKPLCRNCYQDWLEGIKE